MRQSLSVSTMPVGAIAGSLLEDMFRVFSNHYDAVDRRRFEHDLSAKDEVFLIRNGEALAGFSTLAVSTVTFEGGPVRVAFSGDTIIERRFWGSPAFSFAWVREMGRIAALSPAPLYWLLIVKGWRTYRYLGTFGLDFVPHWRAPDDARLLRMRNQFANDRFGDCFDSTSGVVRFANSRGHLRGDCAMPSPLAAKAVCDFAIDRAGT